jgi:pimeloyl-ACP methyl ester carboxylesterase
VKSRPLPVEDVDVAEGLDARLWSFVTPDGLTMRGKRYAVPGGQPIVLAHGYTGNGLEFDIPKKGHNMAAYLARRGFDVYMYSIRGCGREPYVSDPGDWLHTMGHFAALDAPTLIQGITRETGKKPAWLGHSMGGMILYMYLQGATLGEAGGGCVSPLTLRSRQRGTARSSPA